MSNTHHVCFSGSLACSGPNPCKMCYELVNQHVIAFAMRESRMTLEQGRVLFSWIEEGWRRLHLQMMQDPNIAQRALDVTRIRLDAPPPSQGLSAPGYPTAPLPSAPPMAPFGQAAPGASSFASALQAAQAAAAPPPPPLAPPPIATAPLPFMIPFPDAPSARFSESLSPQQQPAAPAPVHASSVIGPVMTASVAAPAAPVPRRAAPVRPAGEGGSMTVDDIVMLASPLPIDDDHEEQEHERESLPAGDAAEITASVSPKDVSNGASDAPLPVVVAEPPAGSVLRS